MAANYPRPRNRSTGVTRDNGQADASCLSVGCVGMPQGPEAPDGSVPDDDLRGYCSTCRFWLASARQPIAGTVIEDWDDGSRHHYYVNPAEPIVYTDLPERLGCGGAPWRIRFFDGRVVETNDLYTQGEIPARFRHMFPPNASVASRGRYGGRRDDGGPPLHLARGPGAGAESSPMPYSPAPAPADFPAGPALAPRPPVSRQTGRPAGRAIRHPPTPGSRLAPGCR
jgi:hypothetical protein